MIAGLGLGLSLIVAIGAQNLFVLRQAIRGQAVVLTAAICAASDAVLIALGVSGMGALVQAVPGVVEVVRWAGAVFLVGYGLSAGLRAWRGGRRMRIEPDAAGSAGVVRSTALTCLALTWLNPHVYLDTVFLLGGVASAQGEYRWAFAVGAMVASLVWFSALAGAGRLLSRPLSSATLWRVLDGVIAVVMIWLGVSLVAVR